MNRRPWGVVGCVLGAAAVVIAIAGPLNPPGGAVSSTYKTLTEVEPRIAINSTNTPGDADSVYRIVSAGSYYLTGNVTGQSGKSGIEIAADNVTLDLNGYTLIGVAGSVSGVSVSGVHTGGTIRDGIARSWGNAGILLYDGSNALNQFIVEGVHATSNGREGFHVNQNGRVINCTAYGNSREGFIARDGVILTGCNALSNTLTGFLGKTACSFDSCIARGNGAGGFGLVSGATGSHRFNACTAQGNTGDGFNTHDGATLIGCSANLNTGSGIVVGLHAVVRDSTANNNSQYGINATPGYSLLQHCAADNNLLSGIRAATHCEVVACMAHQNSQSGVHITTAGVVRDSFFDLNAVAGILMDSGGAVDMLHNQCSQNGGSTGAGIRITTNGSCRVEGNVLALNYRALDISSSGNAVARNYFRQNTTTNTIAGGNDVGPIGSAATATSPWANIQY
ncbi:MAG: right-handed parallel beta-helix repeat-containing protein [Phycisphaerales bacterium]